MRRVAPIVLVMMAAIFALIFVVALRAHALDSAPSTQDSALLQEIVGWEIVENGLCEVGFDRDGDGVADMSELHVVEWSGRSVLTEAELLAVGSLDRVWLFIVEEDTGEFIYAVQAEPLTLSTPFGSEPQGRGQHSALSTNKEDEL